MNNDEKQFENFIRDMKFDDTPDTVHRDKLEHNLLVAMAKQPRHKQQTLNIWRKIMSSRITKLSVAAAAIIIVAVFGWISSNPDSPQQISSFTLLSRASAAEQSLFYSTGGIVHIANEIILHPEIESDAGRLLNELESDTADDKNIAFINSWLSYRWIPIYSLGADGQLHEHKLEPAGQTNEAVTISDLAWYDPVTGCFARVLKTGEQVLFANAYDGNFIYQANKGSGGSILVDREPISDGFHVPENPADFLGIAAGIKGSVPGKHYPPIQNVTTGTLEDGTPVRSYKLGFKDLWGNMETYFLFKVRTDHDIIDEIECIVEGKTARVHKRLIAETVDKSELSWNLSELNTSPAGTGTAVEAGEGAGIINVQQMAQRAASPVYIFTTDPSWTVERKIYDLPDETSAPARMLCVTYRAKDGRDIVLNQGESFNRYFGALFSKVTQAGEKISWTYESQNGFKLMHQNDTKTEMWWTEFALKSSGFEPHTNRAGYILMSPENTFMVMAVNGPVSEQELHELVDSLIQANEYKADPAP